jgi:hypothetical protein
MVYFFRRASDTRICESRLEPHGPGFELIVTEGRDSQIERFSDPRDLMMREEELRRTWSMHGWRTIDPDDDYSDDYREDE